MKKVIVSYTMKVIDRKEENYGILQEHSSTFATLQEAMKYIKSLKAIGGITMVGKPTIVLL